MIKSIEILRILKKSFGFQGKHIGVMIFRLTLNNFAKFMLFFDHFFYPNYKLKKPVNPVFLIGHPRSGTTFLHRFLAKNCDALRAMYLWEMAFPSLTARKFVSPFKEKLRKVSFDKIWNPKIHKTNFFEAETEDVALFLKLGDGFLPWFYFYIWDKYENDAAFEKRLFEICNQDKFVDYLMSVHQKNTFRTDLRVLCKSFALVFNIDKIQTDYPDAKILLMMRDPKSVLPSTISLISGAQEKINGLDKASQEKKQEFYNKVYKTTLAYYKLTDKIISEKRENILLITHKELLTDFDRVFRELMSFYQVEIDNKIEAAIAEQVEKQKTFTSEHKYSLDTYGFTEQQIDIDFKFIYDKYPVR